MVSARASRANGRQRWTATTQIRLDYVEWLSRCWRSHRAAKVIRLQNYSLERLLEGPEGRRVRAIHLVRAPVAVVASRLTLTAFRQQGHFNPDGTPLGVVRHVCARMAANLQVRHPRLMRLRLEDFVAQPIDSLRRLFSHLGVGALEGIVPPHATVENSSSTSSFRANDIPSEVLSMVRRCVSPTTTPSSDSSRRLAERRALGPDVHRSSRAATDGVGHGRVPPAFSICKAEVRRKRSSSIQEVLANGQLRAAVVEQCAAVHRAFDYRVARTQR